MKKRYRLMLGIASLCLAVSILVYGIYAALSVSYNFNVTISYVVENVMADIETRVYSSSKLFESDLELKNVSIGLEQLDFNELNSKNTLDGTHTFNKVQIKNTSKPSLFSGTNTDYFDSFSSLQKEPHNPLNVEMNYSNQDSIYSYFVVMKITNLSAIPLYANVIIEGENKYVAPENSFAHRLTNIRTIDGKSSTYICFSIALKDITSSIGLSQCNFPINISKIKQEEVIYNSAKTYISEVNLNSEVVDKPIQISSTPIQTSVLMETYDLTSMGAPYAVGAAALNFTVPVSQATGEALEITLVASTTIAGEKYYAFCNVTSDTMIYVIADHIYNPTDVTFNQTQITNYTRQSITDENENVYGLKFIIPESLISQTEDSKFAITFGDMNGGSSWAIACSEKTQTMDFEISANKNIKYHDISFTQAPQKVNYASFEDVFVNSTKIDKSAIVGPNGGYVQANYTIGNIQQGVSALGVTINYDTDKISKSDINIAMAYDGHRGKQHSIMSIIIGMYSGTLLAQGNLETDGQITFNIPIYQNLDGEAEISIVLFLNDVSGFSGNMEWDMTFVPKEGEYNPFSYELATDENGSQYYVITGTSNQFLKTANIPAYINEIPVKEIADSAFYNTNPILMYLNLPKTITKIGANAFRGCPIVGDFVLHENIEYIGDYAFSACNGMTSVDIKTTKLTGEYIFYDCAGLTSAKLAGGTTEIPAGTFDCCDKLETIELPDSIQKIGDSAFFRTAITTFEFPTSIKEIGIECFKYSKLKQINIPSTIKIIPDNAFMGCESLGEVIINNNTTTIGVGCFDGCVSLGSIFIPKDITAIDSTAFDVDYLCGIYYEGTQSEWETIGFTTTIPVYYQCQRATTSDFAYFVTIDGVVLTKYRGTKTSIVVPATIYGKSVVEIQSGAFRYNSIIENIVVSEGVKTIKDYAFAECENLLSIQIPSTVNVIGKNLLTNDNKLNTIDVASTNTVYNSGNGNNVIIETATNKLIYGCVGSTIPNTVKTVASYAFSEIKGPETLVVPEGVETIEARAFYNSFGIKNVSLPSTLTNIGDYAFCCCTELETINIPKNAVMGTNVFATSRALANVTLEQGLKSLGTHTFAYCSSLTKISIPSSVETIGTEVFYCCHYLVDVTIAEGIKNIGSYAFYYCSALQTIKLPSTLSSIGSYAFNYCKKLTSIEIPGSLTTISSYAFYYSGLTEVILGEGVKTIGQGAFAYSNVKKLKISSTVTSIYSSSTVRYRSFGNCPLEEVYIDSKTIYSGLTSKTAYGYLLTKNPVVKVKQTVCESTTNTFFTKNGAVGTDGYYTMSY